VTATDAVALVEVARLHGPGDVRLSIEPFPVPGPGEALVRITAVGLCGSDLHWYRDGGIGDAVLATPLVLGHEFAGVIVDGPRAGERVVAEPADPCGVCDPCRAGRANICVASRFAGHGTTDGALRSVLAWPEKLLYRFPDGIGDAEAALLEPLGVAIHALDLGGVGPGDRVGVYGCGPLGLLIVALSRLAGASTIVATDRLAHRVAAAEAMGATHAVLAGEGAPRDAVDVAFEVAGDDDALADAIADVRPGGRVVLVGIPDDDRTTIPAGLARRKELTLQLCRRMLESDLPRAITLVEAGSVDLGVLITHSYPLDEVAMAFATLASRSGLKVVVEPSAEPSGGGRP